MSRAPARLAHAARDDRGAVMVVAVFMAAMLVGGIWYAMGIGDAILYRERMQDGADAVAFSAAVYHARGMNMIAMVNLVMAAILGVLVAVKLLQVVNAIANVVSCASAGISLGSCAPCDAVCGITSSLESPIQDAVTAVENVVKTTLPVLSKLEVGIAVGMPWAAEAKSIVVAKDYDKPVQAGGIVTASLMPEGARLGLPVEEGEYPELCKKAGELVGKVVFSPFGGFGDWVGNVVGGLTSAFPAYFCAGGSVNASGVVDPAVLKAQVQAQCDAKKQALPPSKQKTFDMAGCLSDGLADAQKQLRQKGQLGAGTSMDTTGMTHKVVFAPAKLGDGYFQIWSTVVGDATIAKRSDKGVAIAAWSRPAAGGALTSTMDRWSTELGRGGFAQSEFYYVVKADQRGRPFDDYRDDVMWNLRWRARMRRVRPPGGDMVSGLLSGLGSKLDGKLDGQVKDALANVDGVSWLLGNVGSGSVGDTTDRMFQGAGNAADHVAENPLLESAGLFEVIH